MMGVQRAINSSTETGTRYLVSCACDRSRIDHPLFDLINLHHHHNHPPIYISRLITMKPSTHSTIASVLLATISMHDIVGFTSVSSITRHGAPFRTAAVFAKTDENNEDDDDWRAFRAKLVMSENAVTSETSTETSTESTDEDDLDGFGALFAQKTQGEKTITTSEPKFTIPEGFTPLDPTQWAYDSGRYIVDNLSWVLKVYCLT
jgi:hypothetical protein